MKASRERHLHALVTSCCSPGLVPSKPSPSLLLLLVYSSSYSSSCLRPLLPTRATHRYHLLKPDYIHTRIRELQRSFRLRLVLCHVDAEDAVEPLAQVGLTVFSISQERRGRGARGLGCVVLGVERRALCAVELQGHRHRWEG